jgi:hypothetical protein
MPVTLPRVKRLLALIATVAVSGCSMFNRINSNTQIDPGKSFLLGGNQRGAFNVKLANVGDVPVVVYVERAAGRDSLATLLPGENTDGAFPANSMAVVRNTSGTRMAYVKLVVRGDTDLSMRYR